MDDVKLTDWLVTAAEAAAVAEVLIDVSQSADSVTLWGLSLMLRLRRNGDSCGTDTNLLGGGKANNTRPNPGKKNIQSADRTAIVTLLSSVRLSICLSLSTFSLKQNPFSNFACSRNPWDWPEICLFGCILTH